MSKLFDFLNGRTTIFNLSFDVDQTEESYADQMINITPSRNNSEQGKLNYYDGSKWIEYK